MEELCLMRDGEVRPNPAASPDSRGLPQIGRVTMIFLPAIQVGEEDDVPLMSHFADVPTVVNLLIVLGIGFLSGYGFREMISRRRRRHRRTSRFFS
jgi:hypothetical protein